MCKCVVEVEDGKKRLSWQKKSLWLLFSLFYLAFFCFPFKNMASETNATRAELIAVYIFRLAEHIQWANSAKIQQYQIHIIDEDHDVASQMRKISKSRTLLGKPFIVSQSNDIKLPSGVHLVYVSKQYGKQFSKILSQVENHNVLLISDNLFNQRLIMLNLLEAGDNKIHFEVNKANIINQNLGVDPDIILLGGTEVDVARLFRQGQQNLKKTQDELARIQDEIAEIQLEKEQLLLNMKSNKAEVDAQSKHLVEARKAVKQLQQTTITQKGKLESQTKRLSAISNTLSKQQQTMQIQERTIAQQQTLIRQQQSKYDALQVQTKAQEENIKRQAIALENRGKQLDQQQQEIEKRSTILDNQKQSIKSQEILIDDQNNIIREQETVLKERGNVIAHQKNYLIFLSISVGLAMILVVVVYRGYRNNQKINLHLREQRDLLSSTAEQLRHARDQAETANSAKSTFLANMSHELRTPLNAVLGFSELMTRDNEATTKQRQNLDVINRSGQHLLRMINDVLDLSKIEAGKVDLAPFTFDLVELVQDICAMLRVRAENKGLTFVLKLTPSLPRYVKLDPVKLRQVLINLLGNAVKFTKAGKIILWARCQTDKGRSMLLFEIHDNGIGIPADKLDTIFEPFVQIGTNIDTQSGTGLGLAISRQFIQLMGGKLTVKSVVGRGSVFKISLPFEKSTAKDIIQPDLPRQVVGLADGEKKWKILVVEDKIESRLLLKRLLESTGFEVKEAVDGAEGLRMFEQWQPHLIWMDIRLPVMNGDEVVRRIRNLPDGGRVKIIALTANLLMNHNNSLVEAGCNEILFKPFQSFEIFDAMARQLGVRYRYAELESNIPKPVAKLGASELKQLPSDFLIALQNAARNLDQSKFLDLLNKKDLIDSAIRNGLIELAYDFRFDKILKLCKKALGELETKV